MRSIHTLQGFTDRRVPGPPRGARQIIVDVRAGRHGAFDVSPAAVWGRVEPPSRQAGRGPS